MPYNEFPSSDPNYNPNPSTGSFDSMYPNQALQPQPQPQQQPQFAAQPASAYTYVTPAAYPQQNSGTSGAMIAFTSVLVVVLPGPVNAAAYANFGEDDSITAVDTQPAVTTRAAAGTQGQLASVATQAGTAIIPSSGSSSGSSGSPRSSGLAGGNPSNAWKGTSLTGDPFVRDVHSAYVRYCNSVGRESGTVITYSPTTGLAYDM